MHFTFSYNAASIPVALLKDFFKGRGVLYSYSAGGTLELLTPLPEDGIVEFRSFLERYGIAVETQEKEALVERVRNLIWEIVYDDKPLKVNLSSYLADKIGYSYGYISGCFEKATFCTVEKYYIAVRVERVKRLVMENQLTLKEISHELHYCHPGHLCKQFKKTTGLSISAFRRIVDKRKEKRISLK